MVKGSMKKTLLLAAALACSGVAQADVYFCETKGWANVSSSGEINKGEPNDQYVVNSDLGFKWTRAKEDEYKGSCSFQTHIQTFPTGEEEIKLLKCTDSTSIFLEEFVISTDERDGNSYPFSYVTNSFDSISVWSGTCTKI